ncbi:hypothetical protein LQZ19_07365 [Treponema primitia]|uniref:hypothetical protein n=1 Tax=Treponema primitia TaxID=88058 RepID=UPI00397EE9BB
MNAQGRDCCITLKTQYRELGLPYIEETIREAVSILKEEAAIEETGVCGAIRRSRGVTGCVVTPLSIETAPLLFVLALGRSGLPAFVSETRILYRHSVNLSAMESGLRFDLIQDRGPLRALYEGCRVRGFELRIMRGEAIKLKLDVAGDMPPVSYPYPDRAAVCVGERFNEAGVTYRINGIEQKNIYGLTITTRKDSGTQTEVRIHRVLDSATELPSIIETLEISAQLLHDHYDHRLYGAFRLSLSRLALMADETAINAGDAVIGPLRYYCAGLFSADVFTTDEGVIE